MTRNAFVRHATGLFRLQSLCTWERSGDRAGHRQRLLCPARGLPAPNENWVPGTISFLCRGTPGCVLRSSTKTCRTEPTPCQVTLQPIHQRPSPEGLCGLSPNYAGLREKDLRRPTIRQEPPAHERWIPMGLCIAQMLIRGLRTLPTAPNSWPKGGRGRILS